MRQTLTKAVFVFLLCACAVVAPPARGQSSESYREAWLGMNHRVKPNYGCPIAQGVNLPSVSDSSKMFDQFTAPKQTIGATVSTPGDEEYSKLISILAQHKQIVEASFKNVVSLELMERLELLNKLENALNNLRSYSQEFIRAQKTIRGLLRSKKSALEQIIALERLEDNFLPFKDVPWGIFSFLRTKSSDTSSRMVVAYPTDYPTPSYKNLIKLLAKHQLIDEEKSTDLSKIGDSDAERLDFINELASAIDKLRGRINTKSDPKTTQKLFEQLQEYLQREKKLVQNRIQGGRRLQSTKSLRF